MQGSHPGPEKLLCRLEVLKLVLEHPGAVDAAILEAGVALGATLECMLRSHRTP